jgi:hypothetical protein
MQFVGPRSTFKAREYSGTSIRESRTKGMLDFIERHIGFSPDGGDGTFEVLIVIVTVTTIVLLAMLFFDPRRAKRDAT